MKYFFLLIVVVLNLFPVFSQNDVTSFLEYSSDYERQIFLKGPLDKNDKLKYFLLLNKRCDQTYVNEVGIWFKDIVAQLKEKKIDNKNNNQKIVLIQKLVKKKYLLKYTYNIEFHELYEKGFFNCVTGSALFALIFDEFHIPYQILSSPTHVYLIAFPGNENYIVESTINNPDALVFSKSFKEEYLKMLVDRKTISDLQISKSSTDELFSKYYLSEKKINLWNLIGEHYNNNAIELTSTDRDLAIFSQFFKAHKFNNDERIEHSFMMYLTRISDKLTSSDYASLLACLHHEYPNNTELLKATHAYYLSLINSLYESNSSDSLIQNALNGAKNCINDSATLKDILFNERLLAFDNVNIWETQKQFKIGKEALALKPDYLKLKKIMGALMLSQIEDLRKPELFKTSLDEFVKEFPDMKEDENIKMASFIVEVALIMDLYSQGNTAAANKRFVQLESKFKEYYSTSLLFQSLTEEAYGEAIATNIRKNNFNIAETLIGNGFKIMPASEVLKRKRLTLEGARGY